MKPMDEEANQPIPAEVHSSRFHNSKRLLQKWLNQGEREKATFVHTALSYAAVCGVSPHYLDVEGRLQPWMKKVPAAVVALLISGRVLMLLMDIIQTLTGERETTDVGLYMTVCYRSARVALMLALLMAFWISHNKFQKAVTVLESTTIGKKVLTNRNMMIDRLICFTGFSTATVKTFHLYVDDPTDALRVHAGIVRLALFLPPLGKNETAGPLDVTFGVLETSASFFGNVVEYLAFDLILLAALTIARCNNCFKFKRRSPTLLPNSVGVPMDTGVQIMNEYEEMKKLSKAITSAVDLPLKCVLLTSLFMFAVYADVYFQKGVARMTRVLWLIDLIKPLVTFYWAVQASSAGERFRSWINEGSIPMQLNLSQVDIILEHVSSPAIGLGDGALYVNTAFLLGYAGLIGAYFFGIVETRQQNTVLDFESLFPEKNVTFFCDPVLNGFSCHLQF